MMTKNGMRPIHPGEILREDINIGHLVEGDDIGFQPLQDGIRLLRGTGMRLGDFHVRVFL